MSQSFKTLRDDSSWQDCPYRHRVTSFTSFPSSSGPLFLSEENLAEETTLSAGGTSVVLSDMPIRKIGTP